MKIYFLINVAKQKKAAGRPQRRLPPKRARLPANQRQRAGARGKPKEEEEVQASTPVTETGDVVDDNPEDDELQFDDAEEYDEDNIDGAQLADHFEKLLASGLVRQPSYISLCAL